MELVLEIQSTCQTVPLHASTHVFDVRGGVIGRAADCDWSIPDASKHLSNRHASISFRQGAFYLTDTSRNGTFTATGAQLPEQQAFRIESGARFRMSSFEILARLREPHAAADARSGLPLSKGTVIPDDIYLLNPLLAPDPHVQASTVDDGLAALHQPALEAHRCADYARIDVEHLPLPELVAPASSVPALAVESMPDESARSAVFWTQFGAALGVDLSALASDEREALAIKAAQLLAQSIGDLQQCLRTRSDLKDELQLVRTGTRLDSRDPLRSSAGSSKALALLLRPDVAGQVNGQQYIARAFHDVQAHQVALLSACRTTLRATLEQFSPQQLVLRFERAGDRPLLATAGKRWRAYGRYHRALLQDDEFSARLLARDFAQAYDEQVRLIATLHTAHQG
ncbi:type VI secretion system-associated FHA domain protein TagH [Pseudomonas sp. SDI]|uniref:type VI secretion system-associated FHA domain protein TagH n=1 Tax=Pseudomonas sp. SDI TaxID=2170734 RepID=UPI000DE7AD3E|nr:type VI secretion system-associated FHA domain protein TagH [Pseudomonas sp. SDI]PWB31964.1 type VI secretion system-associated FHA domain protein TagH [Pseudomonas sp. SDI]